MAVDNNWRSIILIGKNVASYKFSLGKTLLDLNPKTSEVKLDDLALPFAKNICEHLKTNPKQITSRSSQFIESCESFNEGKIDESQLKDTSLRLGFNNVIDAFHNVASSEVPRFFQDTRSKNKSITLTDDFYRLLEVDKFKNLNHEVEARWRLWETAIILDINPNLLEIHSDDGKEVLFIKDKVRRINVSFSTKKSLIGYQNGKCFYCNQNISVESGHVNSCDVEHVFPFSLHQYSIDFNDVDKVWNLVLVCQTCNRREGGKFDRIPHEKFVEKLDLRNTFYVDSHHPLKETIMNQTGKDPVTRRLFLKDYFMKAKNLLNTKPWEPEEIYE